MNGRDLSQEVGVFCAMHEIQDASGFLDTIRSAAMTLKIPAVAVFDVLVAEMRRREQEPQ